MNTNINIASWNARGLRNKKEELTNFLVQNNINICLVSETLLNHKISMKINNFFCYRCDRENNRGGGVALLISKNISHTLLPSLQTEVIENIGVKVLTSNNNYVNIYSCYFPGGAAGPNSSKKQKFKSDILKLSRANNNFLIGGDFNGRHSLWGCQRSNCWGNILFDTINSENLQVLYPNHPTYIPSDPRRQPSTLDLFVTNITNNISAATVINDLSSDHLPIKISLNKNIQTIQRYYYNYNKANWPRFSSYIKRNLSSSNDSSLNIEQIDSKVASFNDCIKAAITHSIPLKETKPIKTVLPEHIKNLIQIRNVYRRNWKRFRDTSDHSATKQFNIRIKNEILIWKNKTWSEKLSSLEKGSAPFWNISKVLKKKANNVPILKYNNTNYYTQQHKCDILSQIFSENHSISANLSDAPTESLVNSTVNNFNSTARNSTCNISVSVERVQNIIKNLKAKKSPGLDGLNNKCLKALPKKGLLYITNIFNACYKIGYFPKNWKLSKVIPIKKPSKPPDSPRSYRPISLLSSLSKILEKLIKEDINNFMVAQNILPPQQFGFRKQHNTVQPLIRIRNIVTSNFNVGKSTGMVLLDIKAAFDSVWHTGLIFKMIKYNFPTHLIKFIQSFLEDRYFEVHIGNEHSTKTKICSGCPQGSCLSPILYNIYTADFPTLQNCTTSIFADDTAVLTSGILAVDVIYNLQTALTNVLLYFNKWKY